MSLSLSLVAPSVSPLTSGREGEAAVRITREESYDWQDKEGTGQ